MKLTNYSIQNFKDNARVNQDLIQTIDDGLTAFNQASYPDPLAAPITLAFEDKNGIVIAGLTGRSAYSWMRVDVLWVSEAHRGAGLGKQLLTMTEEIAVERQCLGIHLDTHGFQAPEFYLRLGYEVFGELTNYPGAHSHLYFYKKLKSQNVK